MREEIRGRFFIGIVRRHMRETIVAADAAVFAFVPGRRIASSE